MSQVLGSTTNSSPAVQGTNSGGGSSGYGVEGLSDNNDGVHGRSAHASHSGVWGENTNGGYGVAGSTGGDYPVAGVLGSTSGSGYGVKGSADGEYSTGVLGITSSESSIGVTGSSAGDYGTAVYGVTYGQTGAYAGEFYGAITKSSGSFRIDHPLDPENRYLSHSFVESPDMKNVYDGVGVADANGELTVQMEAWFETLNRDFRYQLTSVGAPAPDMHVKAELSNSRFTIGGARPGGKISWQVTGIRKDPWAVAHPVIVEEEKRDEYKGYYLHPELYGHAKEKGLAWRRTLGMPTRPKVP